MQNEIADRLSRNWARTKSIGPEPYLPLSLSRYKSKIKNWIERRQQVEWKACEKYKISQIWLEKSNDRYVQYINKLNRKYCRMLVGLLTEHVNLRYMLQKIGSKITIKQEMRCQKRNVGTYILWVSDITEGEEKNPWQGLDATRPDKRSETEWLRGFRWRGRDVIKPTGINTKGHL